MAKNPTLTKPAPRGVVAAAETAGFDPPAGGPTPAQEKLALVRAQMRGAMVERDDEIDLVLAALVSREHVLLVGPPGCGKSMLLDNLLRACGGSQFSVLFTKFTTPEEVFGPVSVKGLKEDVYRRVTAGKLPEAEFAFLDEVFKASSAILNTTLKVLNERSYDDGGGHKDCPLELCVAASNEWPTGEDGKELGALFDRFLFRKTVRPVGPGEGRRQLLTRALTGFSAPVTARLTPAEVRKVQEEAAGLEWTVEAKKALVDVLNDLNADGIMPGDRRISKSVGAARAHAYVSGSAMVETEHLEVLQHVLWESPEEQPQRAAKIILKKCNPAGAAVAELLGQAASAAAAKGERPEAVTVKLQDVKRELQKVAKSANRDDAIRAVEKMIKDKYREVVGGDIDMD